MNYPPQWLAHISLYEMNLGLILLREEESAQGITRTIRSQHLTYPSLAELHKIGNLVL